MKLPLSMARFFLGVLWLLLLAGCNRDRGLTLEDLPTPLTPEAYATAVVLTQNAPPPGFNEISFPQIDAGLEALAGWRYEILMQFNGVFARTPREAAAVTQLEVQYNQIASSRRLVAGITSNLSDVSEPLNYEAVILGPDTFIVRDTACLSNPDDATLAAARLGAGTVIGGVNFAVPAGKKAVINGEEVWLYSFSPADLNLPNVRLGDEARILAVNGELWFAPSHRAVIRYYLNLDVENANLFGSTLPVTGSIIIRYDLFDIGVQPNLSVPFGC